MKATELRIGNLVLEDETQQVGQVDLVIIGIIERELNHTYKPIPLTEEWLERFGFKFDGYCSFWKSDIELTKDVGDNHYSVFNVHGNSLHRDGIIQYVHTLQNLYFALTGEELIIKK